MTKLVCQNNISSIFIVKFKMENLKTSDNIPPEGKKDGTAGWLILWARLRL